MIDMVCCFFKLDMLSLKMANVVDIGPIVRAWPNQLHIRDMDAYNQ